MLESWSLGGVSKGFRSEARSDATVERRTIKFWQRKEKDGVGVAAVAEDPRAADALRRLPHHLRVVGAVGVAGAGVGSVVVGTLLGRPGRDDGPDRPALALPPEDVLAVGQGGVHQRAVPLPLVGILQRDVGQLGAPLQGRDPRAPPQLVVGNKERRCVAAHVAERTAIYVREEERDDEEEGGKRVDDGHDTTMSN
ncbi:hypothetical protein BHE74_00016027 [Ensete ventricosum]|nr:hypothetical protein BHE74_00016027 [Ensete ventricosum]RZR94739.1 hypothetical protein BHM03_00023497 [Ensete ventricosum]